MDGQKCCSYFTGNFLTLAMDKSPRLLAGIVVHATALQSCLHYSILVIIYKIGEFQHIVQAASWLQFDFGTKFRNCLQ